MRIKSLEDRIRERNNRLKEYPCDIYLHNALECLMEGKVNLAYSEICWAIHKSFGELSKEEKQHWEKIEKFEQYLDY